MCQWTDTRDMALGNENAGTQQVLGLLPSPSLAGCLKSARIKTFVHFNEDCVAILSVCAGDSSQSKNVDAQQHMTGKTRLDFPPPGARGRKVPTPSYEEKKQAGCQPRATFTPTKACRIDTRHKIQPSRSHIHLIEQIRERASKRAADVPTARG